MLPKTRSAKRLARICGGAAPALAVLAWAQTAPVGTLVSIRLTSGVSTLTSKPAGPVEAVVIAPVSANGRTVVPAGAVVRGTIEEVEQPTAAGGRAALLLRFNSLETAGIRRTIAARVAGVDNARETVDERGRINGILAAETLTGQLDAGLGRLGERYSGFADILSAAKDAVFQPASTAIEYPPGVEMTLCLSEPLAPPAGQGAVAWPGLRPMGGRALLEPRVSREPFRTVSQKPPKPSDLVNLLLLGGEDALRRAFAEAGWSGASGLNPSSKLETLRAVVEDRGYSEAPVSVLLLEGRPPDMVFEKTTNTFAQRHHLRIWRRPGALRGKPVWAGAATHDIGIGLAEAQRTFIHRIDPHIDLERDKVVSDLLFAARVEAFELMERPAVPRQGWNSTGDSFQTDGRVAIVVLRRLQ